jgi:hypothetical protein
MTYQLIDPDETLDYAFNWSAFLTAAGSPADSIASSSWHVAPAGPELSNPASQGAITSTFISGAALGQVYVLTNRVVTAAGRTAEKSVTLACENR